MLRQTQRISHIRTGDRAWLLSGATAAMCRRLPGRRNRAGAPAAAARCAAGPAHCLLAVCRRGRPGGALRARTAHPPDRPLVLPGQRVRHGASRRPVSQRQHLHRPGARRRLQLAGGADAFERQRFARAAGQHHGGSCVHGSFVWGRWRRGLRWCWLIFGVLWSASLAHGLAAPAGQIGAVARGWVAHGWARSPAPAPRSTAAYLCNTYLLWNSIRINPTKSDLFKTYLLHRNIFKKEFHDCSYIDPIRTKKPPVEH